MTTDMDRWEGAADWTLDPWFLKSDQDDLFVSMGFPLEARRDAAQHLAKVYTPEVCRAIREAPKAGYGSVINLFFAFWPGTLLPLLRVGRDLGVVQPWEDAPLLKRLTRRNEFHEVAFELRVLANLHRRGYACERVAERSARKTPDLRVRIGLESHDVEVKAVHPSPIDRAAETLHARLSRAGVVVPGLHLTLLGSEQLAERAARDLDGLMNEADLIVEAFTRAASLVRTTGRLGEYPVPPYGAIRAVPGERFGSVTPAVMPDLSQEQRVIKAMRLVRRATAQLGSRRGIVVLGVWHSADLLQLAEALKAASPQEYDTYRGCHMVVLVDTLPQGRGAYKSLALALPVQMHERRQVTKAQLKFAAVAAGDGGDDATFVRAAAPDEPGIALRTTRREVRTVSLGSVAFPSDGGAVRFHFDGREPEVLPDREDQPHSSPAPRA